MGNAAIHHTSFNYINEVLKDLNSYLTDLSTYKTINTEQKKKFSNFAENMEKIISKWSNGIDKCLELNDINILTNFGDFLVKEK